MKVVGAAEIIVWWDAKCYLLSVEDAKSLCWLYFKGVVAAQLA